MQGEQHNTTQICTLCAPVSPRALQSQITLEKQERRLLYETACHQEEAFYAKLDEKKKKVHSKNEVYLRKNKWIRPLTPDMFQTKKNADAKH